MGGGGGGGGGEQPGHLGLDNEHASYIQILRNHMLPCIRRSFVVVQDNAPPNVTRDMVASVDWHGPLARYVKLRVAHAPGIPGTFSPLLGGSDPDMHHGTCVTHVPWCMSGSLTSGFLRSRWRRKRSRHSRRMRSTQFNISGKRPMASKSWTG